MVLGTEWFVCLCLGEVETKNHHQHQKQQLHGNIHQFVFSRWLRGYYTVYISGVRREINVYTINLHKRGASFPVCLSACTNFVGSDKMSLLLLLDAWLFVWCWYMHNINIYLYVLHIIKKKCYDTGWFSLIASCMRSTSVFVGQRCMVSGHFKNAPRAIQQQQQQNWWNKQSERQTYIYLWHDGPLWAWCTNTNKQTWTIFCSSFFIFFRSP